jgi:hypothetical protein
MLSLTKNPDLIGFSILHANRWSGIEIARIAKKINSKVKTVFGGIGATFLWEHFLTHFKEIDFAVIGEGEYKKALSNFLKFQDSRETPYYIAQCYHALGEFEKELVFLDRFNSV